MDQPITMLDRNFRTDLNDEKLDNSTGIIPRKIPFAGFGIVCGLLCGVFFSVNSLFAKMITLHPLELGAARCYVQFLILLPTLQAKHKTVDIMGPPDMKLFLWLRGFTGSTAMLFLYLSIGQLSVGNAVTVSFSSTVMVPIIARIFLKERFTVLDCVFAILSLTGVVLIAQPSFLFPNEGGNQPQSPLGIAFAVLSAFCASCTFVIIRKLGKQTHFLLNVFYYSFCGSITSTILMVGLGEFRFACFSQLPFLFMLGLLGILGQVFLTLSLQWERAGTASILRTAQIVFIYGLQVIFLHDIPSVLSVVGAALIFSSSIGIGIRKIVNEKKKQLNAVEVDS